MAILQSKPESESTSKEKRFTLTLKKPRPVTQNFSAQYAPRKKKKKKAKKAKPTTFRYKAIDTAGKKKKGRMKASTQHEVYSTLLAQDFTSVTVAKAMNLLTLEVKKKKVKPKKVASFSRQLSVFVKAGVAIIPALETIGKEMDDKLFQVVINDIVASLRDGDSLSTSLGRHPEAFSNLYVAAVGSAEQTGLLDVTLLQMSSYIDREVKMKASITSALVYPGVVTIMGAGTIVVLSTFVLPRFKTFFASFNATLPLPTRILMSASSFLSQYGVMLVGGMFFIAIGAVMFRKTVRGRLFVDTMMLRLPVVGGITTASVIERVCRILASMIRAGVDLPNTIAIAAETSRNGVYRRALYGVLKDAMQGVALADAITETGLFAGTVQQMFRIGEDTGTLDAQLDEAADFYADETKRRVDRATTLFEPAILIVVGGVVGFVAVAMISAMYGIYNQVHVS